MPVFDPKIEEDVSTDIDQEITEPPMYKVIFLNDDYTTMEFVVEVLMVVFKNTQEQAIATMLAVHKHGRGVCGIYPLEVAETKVRTVHNLARERSFPLKCILEKD